MSAIMTDHVIALHHWRAHRPGSASKVRRLLADVAANQNTSREPQEALEAQLIAAPAHSWSEAGDKARYLLRLFAAAPVEQASRRQRLIASVLEDFARLSREDGAYAAGQNYHKAEQPRRFAMANREQRSNREKKKPKAEKPKQAQVLPFGRAPGGPQPKGAAGKKGR